MGAPNTHTSVGLSTETELIWPMYHRPSWVQVRPFQRIAPTPPPASPTWSVKTQTFDADEAPAAVTSSPGVPGNGTCFQPAPVFSQAVGLPLPLPPNAHSLPGPAAATAKPAGPAGRSLAIRQVGVLAAASAPPQDGPPALATTAPRAAPATVTAIAACTLLIRMCLDTRWRASRLRQLPQRRRTAT